MGHEYYQIRDGKIYLNPTLDQPEREIGEVKNSEEETVAYFTNRFEQLSAKIEALKNKIEQAENKGSYMMKLVHMKESLKTYNGIGDFVKLYDELSDIENSLQGKIEQNRERNIQIKEDIIVQLTPLIESDNWTEDFTRVKELQANWNKTGKASEDKEEELTQLFKAKIEQFFKKPLEQLTAVEAELVSTRTQEYQFLIDDAEKLLSGNLKDNLKAFKAIQEKWKELKEIPAHLYEPLLERYKKVGDEFFNALKALPIKKPTRSFRPREIDVKAELEKISTACEDLYTIDDLNLGIKKAKKLQYDLKELKKFAKKRGFRGETKMKAAFEYIFEKQYLEYRLRSKNEAFDTWENEKQQKERISTLNYLIQKNEEEIRQIELNKEKMVFNDTNEDFARIFDSRMTTFARKLKAKQRLLDEAKS